MPKAMSGSWPMPSAGTLPRISPTEIAVLAATQGPTFSGAFDDRLTQAAHESRPSWYIVATHDGMIPPAVQEVMATDIGAHVTRIEASHVVMLSKPKQVADVILDAAAEAAVSPQTKMPLPVQSPAPATD